MDIGLPRIIVKVMVYTPVVEYCSTMKVKEEEKNLLRERLQMQLRVLN